MPALAALIPALVSAISGFLALMFAKKLAIAVAAVAVMGTLLTAFVASMNALLQTVVVAFPQPEFATFLWVMFPPEVQVAVTACLACDLACALYRFNMETVKQMANV